ncbi:RDD family protein [Candidatus Spongiisocius sp.]|uniref:RDD family protein n=1 Tax=Candidatus Spongiisocius sp. TaxID=3101273 RepID=UPI003B590B83
MINGSDDQELADALDCSPVTIGTRIRARVVDSLLHLAAGIGLLFPAGWFAGFFYMGATDTIPPYRWAGFRTLAIPDSDLWAAVFLLYWPIVFLVPILLYEVPLIALRGQTPGKMLNNVNVVAFEDGGPPGWGRSCARWAVLWVPLFIPFGVVLTLLIAISPLFAPDRRGWHDRIAGTMVVGTRSGTAPPGTPGDGGRRARSSGLVENGTPPAPA